MNQIRKERDKFKALMDNKVYEESFSKKRKEIRHVVLPRSDVSFFFPGARGQEKLWAI